MPPELRVEILGLVSLPPAVTVSSYVGINRTSDPFGTSSLETLTGKRMAVGLVDFRAAAKDLNCSDVRLEDATHGRTQLNPVSTMQLYWTQSLRYEHQPSPANLKGIRDDE